MYRMREHVLILGHVLYIEENIYPAIRRAVRPSPQNSTEAKKLGGGPAARKSPIGES